MVYSSRLWSILRLCHGVAAPLLLWALTDSGTVLCDRGVFGASASAARSRGWWLSDLERCDGGKRQRLRFALAKSEAHEAKPDVLSHSSGLIFGEAVHGTPLDRFRTFYGALRAQAKAQQQKKQRGSRSACRLRAPCTATLSSACARVSHPASPTTALLRAQHRGADPPVTHSPASAESAPHAVADKKR